MLLNAPEREGEVARAFLQRRVLHVDDARRDGLRSGSGERPEGAGGSVRIESSFEVPAPPEQAWDLLMDVPRVVPCMPGAELTETIDESSWKARMSVRLGPISLTFDTDVRREEADAAARRARLSARARESRGRGAAQAMIESSLVALDGGTRVDLATDLQLTGAVAQYGRGSIVQDVSQRLVRSFADCLQAQLVGAPGGAEGAVAAQARPVSGLRLALGSLLRTILRTVRRGGRTP
jgi:uncharacterized protein